LIGSDRLVLLNRTDITTSTNQVSVTNVFNAEYDHYKIVVANLTSVDTSASQVSLRFHDGSSTITDSDYHYCRFRQYNNQAADTGHSDASSIIQFFFGEIDGNTGFNTANVGYIFNPFQTGYTFATSESVMSASSHTAKGHLVAGMLRQTISVTGYTLNNPNRNYDEGTILTYGIAN
tara:strand:- start:125 stop:655 length:531 start_codon:yes stop_codon:yes gene_type:complete